LVTRLTGLSVTLSVVTARLQHGEDLQRSVGLPAPARRIGSTSSRRMTCALIARAQPRQDVLAPLLAVVSARLRLQVGDRVRAPVVLHELGERDVVLRQLGCRALVSSARE
jgi:hypothetical protein